MGYSREQESRADQAGATLLEKANLSGEGLAEWSEGMDAARVEGDIGYVRITSFTEQTDSGMRAAITKIREQLGWALPAGFKLSDLKWGLLPDGLWLAVREGAPLTTASVRRQLRKVLGDAGIDVVSSEYATSAAENTALENLTKQVADRIVTRLALTLRQGIK